MVTNTTQFCNLNRGLTQCSSINHVIASHSYGEAISMIKIASSRKNAPRDDNMRKSCKSINYKDIPLRESRLLLRIFRSMTVSTL